MALDFSMARRVPAYAAREGDYLRSMIEPAWFLEHHAFIFWINRILALAIEHLPYRSKTLLVFFRGAPKAPSKFLTKIYRIGEAEEVWQSLGARSGHEPSPRLV